MTVSSNNKKKKRKPIGTRNLSVSPLSKRRGQKNTQRSSLKEMHNSSAAGVARKPHEARADAYVPPSAVATTTVGELIQGIREIPEQHQVRFGITPDGGSGAKIWMAGDASLVRLPCVAIVGSRNVSAEGAARARRLARELSAAGVVVVSGLAKGVDTEALNAAMQANGRTIGVIGTPLTRAYPAENKRLQEKLYREHLLISQFPPEKRVFPSNFPERNKLMAAITDATVIIEATDESGSLHQAAECTRLGRWLFIAKSVADNPSLRWPKDFLHYSTTRVLINTSEILQVLRAN
jgi:DNA processing protein